MLETLAQVANIIDVIVGIFTLSSVVMIYKIVINKTTQNHNQVNVQGDAIFQKEVQLSNDSNIN